MAEKSHKATSTVVAQINFVDILVIENGEKRVAIKPICDALGIDAKSQIDKIKSDEILISTWVLSTSVGADGKDREMFTIPFKYVFGWLFSINPKNVSPEAKESVIKYKLTCYDALYNHFALYKEFHEFKTKKLESLIEKQKLFKSNFTSAKSKLSEVNEELYAMSDFSYIDYKIQNSQLKLDFTESEANND